jgi:hypothetical protein
MQKTPTDIVSLDSYLGCFGSFRIEDTICKSHCALSLRCTVEHEKNIRMELLEDLVSSQDVLVKIQ